MKTTSMALCGLIAGLLVGTGMNAEAITIAHGGDSVDIDFVDINYNGTAAEDAGDTAVAGYGVVTYDYSIGKFEVTADQWAAVTTADTNVGNAGNWSGSQPTASSSWYEAAKFANWLTSGDALQGAYGFSDATTFTGVDRDTALTTFGTIYVLPSEDEWYKAAYLKSDGSGYTTFATGDGLPVAGTDANYNIANTAPWNVGSGSVENNGTYDMGGNVWEWGESAFDGTLDVLSESRMLRGGDWKSLSTYLRSSNRTEFAPGNELDIVGFRVASLSAAVAAVPEPSSVGLLVIGAMGCMLRRKRG
ncbi:SUMF1/EgtB/PvdO family nonheme iron enzyme [Akkermansiaceae bacterium]|nr:SUMF1/EgtB/PvdO family nonheme iron enzyme [Akkermansiaceae bacterium]